METNPKAKSKFYTFAGEISVLKHLKLVTFRGGRAGLISWIHYETFLFEFTQQTRDELDLKGCDCRPFTQPRPQAGPKAFL